MLRSIFASLARQPRLRDAALTDNAAREWFVELMMVIAIVCVLLMLAANAYRTGLERLRVVEAVSLITTDRADAVALRAATGMLRPEAVARGPGTREPLGNHFTSAQWYDDELVLQTRDRGTGPDGTTAQIGFRVAVAPVSGATVWLCGRREPPAGFVAAPALHTTMAPELLPHFCRAETPAP